MLKLRLKPGEYIDIGDDIRVVFAGGTMNRASILVDAPRNVNINRSPKAKEMPDNPYYAEEQVSSEAQSEIWEIIKADRKKSKAFRG